MTLNGKEFFTTPSMAPIRNSLLMSCPWIPYRSQSLIWNLWFLQACSSFQGSTWINSNSKKFDFSKIRNSIRFISQIREFFEMGFLNKIFFNELEKFQLWLFLPSTDWKMNRNYQFSAFSVVLHVENLTLKKLSRESSQSYGAKT